MGDVSGNPFTKLGNGDRLLPEVDKIQDPLNKSLNVLPVLIHTVQNPFVRRC